MSERYLGGVLYSRFRIRYIVWERGGGRTNTGEAEIICSMDGRPLKPLFVRRRGHLSCSEHAAFGIWEGHEVICIHASHHRGDFVINVSKLRATKENLVEEILIKLQDFESLEDVLPTKYEYLRNAIEAAMDKATCYHCRSPHYIKE